MSPKNRQPLIIEPKDFKVFLFMQMKTLSMSPQEFAKHLGVSHQAVYALLDGKLKPSSKILERVGLEIVFRAIDEPGESPDANSETPVKGSTKTKTATRKK